MEHLCKLLNATQTPSTSLVAQTGMSLTTFCGITTKGDPWIIHSGATDHMIGCEKLFTSYNPCPGNRKVKITYGSFSVVAGVRVVEISPNVVLKAVLHVPKLFCNLLSISTFTKDNDCMVNFSSLVCIFQDQISGKTIDGAKEVEGLYYFEKDSNVESQVQTAVCDSSLEERSCYDVTS